MAKKIPVVYWSGTGNTEKMAEAVAEGIEAAGADAVLFKVSETTSDEIAKYDKFALGCPAMGIEVLEESEFEPFFTSLEPLLKDKIVALFGSFGWGGTYIGAWAQRVIEAGAKLAAPGKAILGEPDQAGLSACQALGAKLVKA